MMKRAVLIATILGAAPVSADSILLDGQTLTGVYIRSTASSYYIQNPSDGSTLSVPKAEVDAKTVKITRSRKERAAILAKWKKAKGIDAEPETRAVRQVPKPILPDSSSPLATVRSITEPEPEPERKTVMLTNTPSKVAKRKEGRKVYKNKSGTQIMTNDPSRFNGSKEYVEVQLDYDAIEIPDQFKATSLNPDKKESFSELDGIVDYYAKYYKLEPSLVYAVITAESSGNPYAVSPVGARGLMQLMPGTAQEMGVSDIFDPVENVAGGTQYLSKLMKLYDGKTSLALAGYNAGPGNVKKYGGIPPFNETQNYIRKVLQYERQYKRRGMPSYNMDDAIPVKKDYLPPLTSEHYQIVLANGLTVRAENISESGTHYAYIFQGRSGRIRKDQVQKIYEPA